MSNTFQDLSASALKKVNEANLYALNPFSHNWPQAEVYAGLDISWCITGIPFGLCNPVFNARLKQENIDTTIEAMINIGRDKNVPLEWFIGEDTEPANLGEYLVAHGFSPFSNALMMAIDLFSMKEDVRIPDNLSITEVKDRATLKTWCNITAVGFGMPPNSNHALLKWFTTSLDLNLPMKFYLGWWNGKPVSTSQLFLAEGVAGIYFVATLPEARRRGIGFAITLKPLQEAQKMGYRVGILQASKLGEPVYRSMGFQEYGRIHSYVWMNPPPGA